ncbi:hypothetical protein [Dyella silvatica]|uniref:hypothetical protein n=1 Tax=Dyella silvatica TaxID=2992128 RepID=UPI00224E1BBA|nr:hypothetical protein [Dyella silvatica]
MTRTSRTPLHRPLAAAVLVAVIMASSFSAQAQYDRRDGYRGRPAPTYRDRRYDNRRDYRDDRRNNGGALIAGALLGVIAGAAMTNANTPQPPPEVIYRTAPPPPPPGVVYYDNSGY